MAKDALTPVLLQFSFASLSVLPEGSPGAGNTGKVVFFFFFPHLNLTFSEYISIKKE